MVSHGFSKLKLLHSYSLGDCLAEKRELYSGILASAHSSLSSSKKLGIISSIFSDYNDIKPKKSITGRKLKKKTNKFLSKERIKGKQRLTEILKQMKMEIRSGKLYQTEQEKCQEKAYKYKEFGKKE